MKNKHEILVGRPQLSAVQQVEAQKILGQMAMAKALSMQSQQRQPTAEQDPRFHRTEKISPAEYFISVGPGEIEGEYYAVVMAPKPIQYEQGVVIIDPDPYIIVAKCNYGFATEAEAKRDAARQFPSLPVLSGPEEYQYPFYQVHKMQVLTDAQKRRATKAEKQALNIEKSKRGYNNAT